MGKYILKRVLISIPVLFLISIGAFVLVHLTPGDPADMYISPDMTAAQVEMTRGSRSGTGQALIYPVCRLDG